MPRGGRRPGAGRKPKSNRDLPAGGPADLNSPAAAEQHVAPPADTFPSTVHAFQPGQSGNPGGRRAVGASALEWLNVFGDKGLTEEQLRAIARSKHADFVKRGAAIRALRLMEVPDLADFQSLADGEQTLKQARAKGANTELVKKLKTRTRTSTQGTGEDKVTTVEVEREIELFDRSGEDFDRIVGHTHGRPRQTVGIQQEGPANVTIRILGLEEAG